MGFSDGSGGKNAMQEPQETWVQDPLEKGHGNTHQYSCLENSMDRGNWRAIVYEVAKSWTQLSN